MPERRLRRGVLAVLALLLTAGASPLLAREVKATFLSLDENGERRQQTLENLRYGYFVRELLSVERGDKAPAGEPGAPKPLPHRDRTLRKRALVLQNAKIALHMIRSIDFTWRPSETPGTQVLTLRVTLVTGTEKDVLGSDLRGFESFSPPFLEGMEADTAVRFPLAPFRLESAPARPGDLERIVFHTQRRPPPEKKK